MALTSTVIMPGADYQAACDAIRAKTGKTALIKSGDLAAEISSIGDNRVKYVTFMNGDTELIKYPVITGDTCRDPVALSLVETPTKEMTETTVYTYSGWSLTDGGSASADALENVTEDRVVYAAYDEHSSSTEMQIEFSYSSNYQRYSATVRDGSIVVEEGKTYAVDWDGVRYICTATAKKYLFTDLGSASSTLKNAIGNAKCITHINSLSVSTTLIDTGEPFIIYGEKSEFYIITTSNNATHTIKVTEQ